MAISRTQGVAAQATSATITAPAAGDIIVVFAHRDGSTTAPTLPSGYTNIVSGGANTNSARAGWKYSDGTETSTSVWTNATSVAVGVYRGCDPMCPIGQSAQNGSASTSVTTSTITPFEVDSTSWIVGFGAHRTATNLNQNLSGLTLVASATDINISDTNTTANSYTGGGLTVNANSGWRTVTIELVAKQSTALPSQFVQGISTSSNENLEAANGFVVQLPNPTGANNCVVFGVTAAFNAGRTLTITDNVGGNTYTKRQGFTADGGNILSTAQIVCEGVAAGTQSFTFTFDTTILDFQVSITEWCGIATSSAYDTGASSNAPIDPQLQTGAITTAAANELVIMYGIGTGHGSQLLNNTVVGWRAKHGFRLIQCDVNYGVFLSCGIVAAAGSMTPTLYAQSANGPAQESFNMNAIALKTSAGAGTPGSGMRVINIVQGRTGDVTPPTMIPAPVHGNLQVLTSFFDPAGSTFNSIVASGGGTWVLSVPNATRPQALYAQNLSDDGCNVLSFNTTDHGHSNVQYTVYDIAGAAASAYDGNASASGGATSSGASIAAAPSITPSAANGLILAVIQINVGPIDTVSPAAVLDYLYYSTAVSSEPTPLAGSVHFTPSSAAAQSVTWHDTQASTTWAASAWSFLAPVAPNQPVIVSQAVQRAGSR